MNAKQVHEDSIDFQENYLIAKITALKLRLPPGTLVRWKASDKEGLYDVEEIKHEDDWPTIPPHERQKCQLIDIDKL